MTLTTTDDEIDISLGQDPPCEIPSHARKGRSDKARFVIRFTCPCCSKSRTYACCNQCWLAMGHPLTAISHKACGKGFWRRDEVMYVYRSLQAVSRI
jgi:hypothetical protein